MTEARLGAIFMFLAVAMGAFGAHGLKGRLTPEMMDVYRTAVLYHLIHALALFALGVAAVNLPGRHWGGILFVAGILLFSGSLYLLSITGIKWLGAITPLGGLCFLAGWLFLALGKI